MSRTDGLPFTGSLRQGWRMPPGAQYVGRPTRWGNPYSVGCIVSPAGRPWEQSRVESVDQAVDLYRRWVTGEPGVPLSGWNHSVKPPSIAEIREHLGGRSPLVCWCPTTGPCHADVLLSLANP